MADTELATVAGGCFWCIEAPFKELRGVASVTSGYCGGHVENPSYEAVCREETGHAEAVQIEYDPDELDYEDILAVFFTVHDPTTVDRQGPDVGSQYRSGVFYHDDEQKEAAEAFIEELEADGIYDDPIVTEVSPLETFYEAEGYHQDYFEKNPNSTYCTVNINPKLSKLRERFADKLA
ncbi:peptide-methionine (S)-S-oxide reductase MsrA [Halogranum rubrum]|uniref:Peptide methionine sulfoxide reductase MsrA n=1 Tax=Halogranum salarium B-1 TaxID=1210908 RepID=J3JD14_9EURY|nr:peptide-methionine (S)-S-oxide reductase MsrA [Halogranum salarium]EJN57091.1 methionine sulfoxide reductase A [Halogranum salarium B-1]